MADLSKVKDSRCFGIAWADDAPECKMCEVCNACKQRTLSGVKTAPSTKPATKPAKQAPAPEVEEDNEEVPAPKDHKPEKQTVKATKPAKAKAEKKEKPVVNYSDDMPEFKELSIEELLELATSRGIDVTVFDKYTAPNIKRMRVIMALKETYKI